MPKAIAQFTIRDENDITIESTPPLNPFLNQLWLDTSKNPSVMKRYNGQTWEIVNDVIVGGRNLIMNSRNPTTKDSWTVGTINLTIANNNIINENTFCLTNTSVANENSVGTKRYLLEGGKDYSFSMRVFIESNVSSVDVAFLMRRKGSVNDFDYSPHIISGYSTIKNLWVTLTCTVKIPSDAYEGYIRIDNNRAIAVSLNTIWFTEVKLEKGNVVTDYSPAPEDIEERISETEINLTKEGIMAKVNESLNSGGVIASSIMKFGKDGLEIDHSNAATKTVLDAEGMKVVNKSNSAVLSHFGEGNSAFIDKLMANKVYSSNVPYTVWQINMIYVSPNGTGDGSSINSPLNSIQSAFDIIKENQKIAWINKDYTVITTDGTYIEDVTIEGFNGTGLITLLMSANTVLTGCLNINYNSVAVSVYADKVTSITQYPRARIHAKTGENCIKVVQNSNRVFISAMVLAGNGTGNVGIRVVNSIVFTEMIDFTYLDICIAGTSSIIYGHGNRGSNISKYDTSLNGGSTMYRSITKPNKPDNVFTHCSTNYYIGSVELMDSGYNKPPIVNKVVEQTFSPNSVYSNRSYKENGVLRQGAWDDGFDYGWWTGVANFGSQIVNFSNGGTNTDIKIYVERESEAHGNTVASVICRDQVLGTLIIGQGLWFVVERGSSLYNSILAGSILSFYFAGKENYIKYTNNVKIWVRTTKLV